MARGGAKRKRARVLEAVIDATPERLAKGDESIFVDPAKIDSSEQRIGYVRQFRKETRLDQWHRRLIISQRQYAAGHEYRSLHMRAIATPRVVASYGERTTGGETDYGLARTDAQARARSRWRGAREAIPRDMIAFLDRLLIHDSLPQYRGRAQMRTFAQTRNALDALALHFETAY
jgi:hypothetical protein